MIILLLVETKGIIKYSSKAELTRGSEINSYSALVLIGLNVYYLYTNYATPSII